MTVSSEGPAFGPWEEVKDRHRELTGVIEAVEQQADRVRREAAQVSVHPREGSRDQLMSLISDPTGPPGGVYGVGLTFDRPDLARVTVLVRHGLAPWSGAPVDVTLFGSAARNLLNNDVAWPRQSIAIGLPPPDLQSGPIAEAGMRIRVGLDSATLGLPVLASSGSDAFTTAGHACDRAAAQWRNADQPGYARGPELRPIQVRDPQDKAIGVIDTFSSLLSRNHQGIAGNGPVADIGIVEILPDVQETPDLRAVDSARERDDIVLSLDGRSRSSWVRTIAGEFVRTREEDSWGQVLLTAACISRGGDSGGLVTRLDGVVVGHIVGAHKGLYSIVQDMTYCLMSVGAVLR